MASVHCHGCYPAISRRSVLRLTSTSSSVCHGSNPTIDQVVCPMWMTPQVTQNLRVSPAPMECSLNWWLLHVFMHLISAPLRQTQAAYPVSYTHLTLPTI